MRRSFPRKSFLKTSTALLLSASLVFSQAFPVAAFGAPDEDVDGSAGAEASTQEESGITDFNESDFAALGLTLDEDTSAAGDAPYSTTSATQVWSHAEVYTAANGHHNNRYVIRDGLDTLGTIDSDDTKLADDYGVIYGGGGFWSGVNAFENDMLKNDPEYGGGTSSLLSSNSAENVLANEYEGFSGIYAQSVEFSNETGTSSKDNCIAELRAYGDGHHCKLSDGKNYTGGVNIELMSVDASGERSHLSTLTPTLGANQTDGTEFYYLNGGYQQVLNAYFDIAAADVDGDGADEIFCYAGAYEDRDGVRYAIVDMFRHSADDTAWSCQQVKIAAGQAADYDTTSRCGNYADFDMQASPVVTISAGDLDRNGAEEVAVTVSAPFAKKNCSSASCTLFTWSDANLKQVDDLPGCTNGVISLAASDTQAMISANSVFGSFKAYGSDGQPNGKLVEGLIIAGYESTGSTAQYTSGTHLSHFGYRYLYYDAETSKYVLSDYISEELGYDAKRITESATENIDQDDRYACTLAPIAMATADLQGLTGGTVRNDAVLIGGDIYESFACTTDVGYLSGLGVSTGHISLCADHYNCSNNLFQKDAEQIWISDVVSGCVSNSENFGESFLAVVGVHRDEDLDSDDNYYWMDLSHYSLNSDGKAVTGEEEVIVQGSSKNSTYGTWISLCLPDIDNDGVRLTYDSQYKTYTNPQVLAVLQDAPYFGDLQDSFDYLVLGGTGFGSGSGSSYTTKGLSLEGELGVGIEIETGFLGGVNVAGELCGQGSYDYEEETSVTYSATYESHAGEGDKAVVYTLPMIYYFYQVQDEASGKTGLIAMPVSLGVETSVVSVELYDEMAAAHNMTTLSEYLVEKSGQPGTYLTATSSSTGGTVSDSFGLGQQGVERYYTSTVWTGCNNQAGASVSQTIEVEEATSRSYEVGGKVSAEVMGGLKIFGQEAMAGVVGEFAAGYTHMTSDCASAEFEGTVDNLPEAAEGYGFSWRLGVNGVNKQDVSLLPDDDSKTSGDTDNFWIIGYDVKDVAEADAPIVTGFDASASTSNSLTLSWNDAGLQDTGYRYGIGMLDSSSTEENVKVSSWKTADDDATSLVWDGLAPSANYRFVIAAIDQAGNPAGARSSIISAATMPSGMSLSVQGIQAQVGAGSAPTDPLTSMSSVSASVADQVTLYALGGVTRDSQAQVPNYTWYKKAPDGTKWEVVSRSTAQSADEMARYTLDSISADDDGSQYYCMVSYDSYSLQTPVIRIDVDANAPAQVKTSTWVRRDLLKLHQLSTAQAQTFDQRQAPDPAVMPLFSDVTDKTLWYYESVERAAELGMFSGYEDGTFGANDTLTRAQAAVVLWNYLDPDDACAYESAQTSNQTGMSDVQAGQWYTGAANWAVRTGVINGYDNADGTKSFAPDSCITREQLCVIMANAVRALRAGDTSSDGAALVAMPDGDQVSTWARGSVSWALDKGIVSGVETVGLRYVAPANSVTRAEMAAMMVNAVDDARVL